MLESVDQNALWRYKQRYHDISKSQIDQQIVHRRPRNKIDFSILLHSFKLLSVSKFHLWQIIFSNPKIKQRNITYLSSFQTDIKTILRLVLTVLRKMPLLQYYNIFNPSEVIYTQDKRILDITALSISDPHDGISFSFRL